MNKPLPQKLVLLFYMDFASKTPNRPKKIKPFTPNMKENTQVAHTKFQNHTTSPTGVIAKRKKRQKVCFGPLSTFHFSHSIKL
jgi:ribosomal protein L44E